jgi:mRNA interferase MazF
MKKGDLVLIPFPFTDLSGVKNRPALVLITTTSDVTVAFLTTYVMEIEALDIPLFPTPENGLKKRSLLRLNKIATLSKDLILGRLGSLTEVDRNLVKLFQIEFEK